MFVPTHLRNDCTNLDEYGMNKHKHIFNMLSLPVWWKGTLFRVMLAFLHDYFISILYLCFVYNKELTMKIVAP